MKKFLIVFSAAMLLFACGEKSKKGAWTEKDKEKANSEIKKVEKDLDLLGDKKQAYIDCYLEKIENSYDNFLAADSDEKGCEKLAIECGEEIFQEMMQEDY